MATTPVSSGSRNDSSTRRSNSGNSSRNSTPRCARLTSPGRACGPPPMMALAEARVVWRAKRPPPVVARIEAATAHRRDGRHVERLVRAAGPAAVRADVAPACSCRCRAGRSATRCVRRRRQSSVRACPAPGRRHRRDPVDKSAGARHRDGSAGVRRTRSARAPREQSAQTANKLPAPTAAAGAASRASRHIALGHDHAARVARGVRGRQQDAPDGLELPGQAEFAVELARVEPVTARQTVAKKRAGCRARSADRSGSLPWEDRRARD